MGRVQIGCREFLYEDSCEKQKNKPLIARIIRGIHGICVGQILSITFAITINDEGNDGNP